MSYFENWFIAVCCLSLVVYCYGILAPWFESTKERVGAGLFLLLLVPSACAIFIEVASQSGDRRAEETGSVPLEILYRERLPEGCAIGYRDGAGAARQKVYTDYLSVRLLMDGGYGLSNITYRWYNAFGPDTELTDIGIRRVVETSTALDEEKTLKTMVWEPIPEDAEWYTWDSGAPAMKWDSGAPAMKWDSGAPAMKPVDDPDSSTIRNDTP